MMRALTWHGTNDVRVDTVSDPEIINPRDAIIKVRPSDLRLRSTESPDRELRAG